ncbi:nuclear speckle splicing regulatory protein 1 [Atheta coriaria]|uniref:nuclear speckle splicing regulatory protein 1 n=1 Tax=Dalotia coriaria TaxID=877792 RepID=UPI0031F34388
MSKPPEKKYGLILPNKQQKPSTSGALLQKPGIFQNDSDSDESIERPTGISTGLKRQDKEIQNKAIEEDPTIYQYDELYDDMDKKRKDSKLSRKDLDKKPKYISNLLKAAEKRKIENERRIERQVQREREAEGNEFKDKEQFVTASYKKKLEEMRKQEELEKREEYLEAIGDVKKQGNLDGFYRHLYEQKVNYDEDKEKKMEDIKTNIKKEDSDESDNEKPVKRVKHEKRRQYRRKRSHSISDDSETEEKRASDHLPSNLDADSDFSIDSDDSTSDRSDTSKSKVSPQEIEVKIETKVEKASETKVKADVPNGTPHSEFNGHEKEEKKPKIDIWKKRTVGAIFDAAVQRYYEREAQRNAVAIYDNSFVFGINIPAS